MNATPVYKTLFSKIVSVKGLMWAKVVSWCVFDHDKYFQLRITFTGQGYIIGPLAAELQKVSTQINCVLTIKGLFTHPISECNFAVS